MGILQPYGSGSLVSRANRDLSRVSQRTDVELARSASAAEIESARLDGLQMIAGRAMHGVALVSQLEQQLSQMVPLATSRLQAIGDIHALASAEVVSQAIPRLGR